MAILDNILLTNTKFLSHIVKTIVGEFYKIAEPNWMQPFNKPSVATTGT